MSELRDTIQREVRGVLHQPWDTRVGTVVPSTDTVALNGGRVDLCAVMLYADLADSTVIAIANREAASRLFRAYLALCARVIVRRGGEIRSFDGDRIMAVFVGADASTAAVCAGLEINWCFQRSIQCLSRAAIAWPRPWGLTAARLVSFAAAFAPTTISSGSDARQTSPRS
ncbi:hypothetical protein [Brevundimonas sanguinis]|uniref:hypothetical protein n=1 Tax=Brevundimonas sanguinis TaxID=3021811 RepID=UPI00241574FB|nr:hypothetical protein [Brevundimonas sp. NCCP 15609]